MNQVLCPKCLVQPGDIYNYGTDLQGFWFKATCPHCSSVIKWYRKTDLSTAETATAPGVQLSLFAAGEKKPAHRRISRKKAKKDDYKNT